MGFLNVNIVSRAKDFFTLYLKFDVLWLVIIVRRV